MCLCTGGLRSCGAACVDDQTDEAHCGGCEIPCAGGEECTMGTCRSTRIFAGALDPSDGRWTYAAMLGVAGANTACNATYPGSSICTVTRLQAAPASERMGAFDPSGRTVTSFWAHDPTATDNQQCFDIPSSLRWAYNTGHTPARGQTVTLTGATGALGPVTGPAGCGASHWVACCF